MNPEGFPAEIMVPLTALLASHLGLAFPPKRWPDLMKGLASAAPELGFREAMEVAEHLLAKPVSQEVLAVLASQLTIGETYFFREPGTFTVLANQLLPPLLATRRSSDRRLRLWSAGCASGEEAYSLAITVHQAIPDWPQWQILLLATDINPQALEKARRGVYSAWSFRGVSAQVLRTYFTPLGNNKWEIKPWLRQMVTFAPLNLARDPFPADQTKTTDLDIIFCRNVLMYLAPEVAESIIGKFAAALTEGGWLLVSPAECSLVQTGPFRPCPQGHAIPFQKIAQRVAPSWEGVQSVTPPPTSTSFQKSSPHPTWATRSQSCPSRQPQTGPRRASHGKVEPAPTPVAAEPAPTLPELTAEGDLPAACLPEPQSVEADGDAAAMAALAKHYADLGHLETAFHWSERARQEDCLNPHHYYLQASILMEQNRLEEAGRLLRQALYLQHDFILAHFLLGRLSLEQQRPQEALRHFNNTLFLLNNYPDEAAVPAAEGMTMGTLRQLVAETKNRLTGVGAPARPG